MKLKTISVEYGRVVNLGEYNSLRASCTLGAELEDGEDADAALAALWEQARESVRGQVLRVVDRKGQRAVSDGDADNGLHPDSGTEEEAAQPAPGPSAEPGSSR